MSPRPPADSPERPYEVAIVGNDAVLAALPSRPMQLAHALLACGFDLVVPVSWGEELVAEYVVRTIADRGSAPAILCACPLLRARLLAAGGELAPHILAAVSPAVAAARYLRALHPGVPMRITVVGGCPGVRDVSIDSSIAPLAILRMLSDRGLSLVRQPAVFESVIPPDRRRFLSLPGGCPAPRALETRAPERRLVTITDAAFATELADHLLGHENVLIDLSTRLACACCGGFVGLGHRGPMGREEILRHEPPRARSPVVDHDIALLLHVGEDEFTSAPSREMDDDPDRGEPLEEEPRLPGAPSIDALRRHVERQRIAVTPAAAVSPVPSRRSTRPPRSTAAWSGLAAPPLTPTTRPDWSTRAVAADDSPFMIPAGFGAEAREGYPSAPVIPPADAATLARGDVVVPLMPQQEGVPPEGERVAAQGMAPLDPSPARPAAASLTASLAAPSREAPAGASDREALRAGIALAGESVADATAAYGGLVMASVQATGRSRSRFRLSRSQLHPRVRSLGGQTLPRAYIRHSLPAEQRVTSAGAPEEVVSLQHLEVEVRLDVSVELAGELAGELVGEATREPTASATAKEPAAAAAIVSSTGAAESTASNDLGPARDLAHTRSKPPAPSRVARTDARGEAGAAAPRTRGHARGDARDDVGTTEGAVDSPPARDVESLAVVVVTVAFVVVILILLAITFRWAPTAPWQ